MLISNEKLSKRNTGQLWQSSPEGRRRAGQLRAKPGEGCTVFYSTRLTQPFLPSTPSGRARPTLMRVPTSEGATLGTRTVSELHAGVQTVVHLGLEITVFNDGRDFFFKKKQ